MFDKDWWEVEVHIRISGRGKIGADGMAIWYTVDGAPAENGDKRIYGSRDRWQGLGILLDSFDNNNQQDNPYIMAFFNDGTKMYNHHQVTDTVLKHWTLSRDSTSHNRSAAWPMWNKI